MGFYGSAAHALCFCMAHQYLRRQHVLGISIGLGMMSKYSVAFFTVSIFAGLLFTKHRRIFLSKHFWYAMLVAFIIFLPNFIWQYNHHFPVVHHMQELQRTQLQYISP